LFFDPAAWFPFTSGQHAQGTWGDPGMLMKIKQVSQEFAMMRWTPQKTKYLKVNRLSASIVGYHGDEK
jgi:hypothetical protein